MLMFEYKIRTLKEGIGIIYLGDNIALLQGFIMETEVLLWCPVFILCYIICGGRYNTAELYYYAGAGKLYYIILYYNDILLKGSL